MQQWLAKSGSPCYQILWLCGDHHMHIWHYANRYHIFGDLIAEPDARIVILCRYIGQAIVDVYFYFDIRVVRVNKPIPSMASKALIV